MGFTSVGLGNGLKTEKDVWNSRHTNETPDFPALLGRDGGGSTPLGLSPKFSDAILRLHSQSHRDPLIRLSLDSLLTLMDASAGSLYLWDEFQKGLVLRAARGPTQERLDQGPVRLQTGILGKVAGSGDAVHVIDLREDARFRPLERKHHYRSSSFMSLPLVARNRLIGVVNITEREDLRPFSADDYTAAQWFARHIALAFEDIRFADKLRVASQEFQKTVAEPGHGIPLPTTEERAASGLGRGEGHDQ